MQKASRSKKLIILSDIILFLFLYAGYIGASFYLFYHQTGNFGGWGSDMPAYLMVVKGEDSGYDFPYPLMFLAARFFAHFSNPVIGLSVAVTLLNGLTPVILKYWISKKIDAFRHPGRLFLSTAGTYLILVVSMLYPLSYLGKYNDPGPDYLYRYNGVFSPNTYHNATSICARPFALESFFLFGEIFEIYEQKKKWICKEYVVFSAFLCISTLTKPSFTIVFGLMALVLMTVRLIRSKFQNTKQFFQLGIYFIPTILVLLYQYKGVFTASGESTEKGIGIYPFLAWSQCCKNIPLSILLGAAFPLSVILFHIMVLKKNNELYYSLLYYLFSLASLIFLYEKGWRMSHVNFAWGYVYGLFFLFTASFITVIRDCFAEDKKYRYFLPVQFALLALHLICGIDYLRILLLGGSFS